MHWNILSGNVPHTAHELIDILLHNRGIADAQEFLHPTHPNDLTLSDVDIDPAEVRRAVDRLVLAKENKDSILIYGDYDCDGVCATAVLWETLFSNGFKALPFIPHREKHGYGLSQKGVDEILEKGKPGILITVDNGIVAHTQWQRLKEAGVYTILTDHHQPDNQRPPVDALIHTTNLCGTTVAWMLAREVEKRLQPEKEGREQEVMLDLAAIATIADQVPLIGANRSFASYGLKQLNRTERLGLRLLIEVSGLRLGEIDTYAINFGLAPRINAMGRLEHALDALRALCTRSEEKGRQLIGKLQNTNIARQDLTSVLIEQALKREDEWKDEHIIIVESPDFHEGIIGLIAGKLCEQYNKPAICISVGTLTSKASVRSVAGVHITEFLRKISDDLLEVGGHPMAAGFKVETAKIEAVRSRLYALAKSDISRERLKPHIDADCVLPSLLLTLETAEAIETLEPFGSGNRQPLFAIHNLRVLEARTVGKENKHLKLFLRPEHADTPLSAMAFGKGDQVSQFPVNRSLSCVGNLVVNGWNGKKNVQLIVRDVLIS